MSATPDFLASSFFDVPSLLASRVASVRPVVARPLDNYVWGFIHRKPDAAPGQFGTMATIACGAGLIAILACPIGIKSCADHTHPAPQIIAACDHDAGHSVAWKSNLSQLADDLSPSRTDLRPWMLRPLLEIPKELGKLGNPSGGWLKPRCASEDQIAFDKGQQLAETLVSLGAGRELAIVLDLPGPQSVAAAAGMVANFDPVFAIDNLACSKSVVPAEQTLAAAVYWAATFKARASLRKPDAPAVFILEGKRLNVYDNQPDLYDNRSLAHLPDARGFQKLGVARILYVRENSATIAETEDLNELFCTLPNSGVEVRHLALSKIPTPPTQLVVDNTSPTVGYRSSYAYTWFSSRYQWYTTVGVPCPHEYDMDANYRARPKHQTLDQKTNQQRLDGGLHDIHDLVDHLQMARTQSPTHASSSSGTWGRTHSYSGG